MQNLHYQLVALGRDLLRLSQASLAHEIGIHQSEVCHYERGLASLRPDVERSIFTLLTKRLCAKFNLPEAELDTYREAAAALQNAILTIEVRRVEQLLSSFA